MTNKREPDAAGARPESRAQEAARTSSEAAPKSEGTLGRAKLVLLSEGERIGYDPYDTVSTGVRDIWAGKRKRA